VTGYEEAANAFFDDMRSTGVQLVTSDKII